VRHRCRQQRPHSLTHGEYKRQHLVYEINKKGAELAERAADEATMDAPHKPRIAAGAAVL